MALEHAPDLLAQSLVGNDRPVVMNVDARLTQQQHGLDDADTAENKSELRKGRNDEGNRKFGQLATTAQNDGLRRNG